MRCYRRLENLPDRRWVLLMLIGAVLTIGPAVMWAFMALVIDQMRTGEVMPPDLDPGPLGQTGSPTREILVSLWWLLICAGLTVFMFWMPKKHVELQRVRGISQCMAAWLGVAIIMRLVHGALIDASPMALQIYVESYLLPALNVVVWITGLVFTLSFHMYLKKVCQTLGWNYAILPVFQWPFFLCIFLYLQGMTWCFSAVSFYIELDSQLEISLLALFGFGLVIPIFILFFLGMFTLRLYKLWRRIEQIQAELSVREELKEQVPIGE